MQYSVVRLKDVFEDNEVFRFDAGYYYPPAYNLFKKVKSLKFSRIKECFTVTKLAGFEYTDYFTSKNVSSDDYYIVLTSKNIQHEELVLDDYLRIDKKTADQYLNRSRIKKGDIVLSYTGEYRRALVIQNDGFQLGPNICLIRQKEKTLNPYYVSTFLNANAGQLLLDREKTLSAQPTVAMSRIREIPIPLLSEIFQSRIEKIILESKRNQLYANDLYRQAEQILLSELGLLDWKPKHQLSFVKNFAVTQSAGRTDADYFQPIYDEIVMKLESHPCKKLKDVTTLIGHPTNPPYETETNQNKTFILTQRHLSQYFPSDNFWEDPEALFTTEAFIVKNEKYLLQNNDIILYSVGAYIGKANIYISSVPATIGSFLTLIRPDKNEINPYYLLVFLNSICGKELTRRCSRGLAQQYVYPFDIKEFVIPIISEHHQQNIENKMLEAQKAKKQSKKLLDSAKRAVEMAIEKNEEEATRWLNEEGESGCQITM